ncbi:hypothetical protein BDP27DRAFT_1426662 [Rhodocollybia butyracea]|uniref:Uncharacterized protein n=1 Tax=Rhodocollybia butyracea TaxID=206335 RepID=A0A9P5U3F3_9AGAR|nr:hypothetical protein BDP27DRAFT_1426662 [Rhodocollybia butyracea]
MSVDENTYKNDASVLAICINTERVLRADMILHYQFMGTDAPRQTSRSAESVYSSASLMRPEPLSPKTSLKPSAWLKRAFFKEVNAYISIDADDSHYTRAIGTVELDSQKSRITSTSETNLLPMNGVLIRELLAIPECYNKNGDAIYIIGKDGNTTDFTVTVGRIFAMSLVDSLSR